MYEMDQYTVALLHFEDGIKDESGKVWTANGGAVTSTQQKKIGLASLYRPAGTSAILKTTENLNDFIFGEDDFTIDFWTYCKKSNIAFATKGGGSPNWTASGHEWTVHWDTDGKIYLQGNYKVTNQVSIVGSPVVDIANGWHHLAFVREKGIGMIFLDGLLQASGPLITSNVNGGNQCGTIGSTASLDGDGECYIDEFRISKGIARWTSDFTPPGNIVSPTNLTATAGDSQVTLSWTAVTGATGYNVKRSTTAGGSYTTVGTNVTGATYVDVTAVNGTTYYYVVTALTADGESGNSNEASATPKAGSVTPPNLPTDSGKILLEVTLMDEHMREYQLTQVELDSFITWYTAKSGGTGPAYYTLNKYFNRKDYLVFDKIITFEVTDFTK